MSEFIYDTYNSIVYEQIAPHSRVLDVGCATGRLGEALAAKDCICSGIEIDAGAAARAKAHYPGGVFVLDLDDEQALAQLKLPSSFDYVVFADILEHLRRPERALELLGRFLAVSGTIVCAIPNIAYWRRRLMLLRGDWTYEETGICDRTHLRFFTETSARELVRAAGLRVQDLAYQGLGGTLQRVKRRFPRLFASGFVIRAVRPQAG